MSVRIFIAILLSIVLYRQGNAQSFESRLADLKSNRSNDNREQMLSEYSDLANELIIQRKDSLLGSLYHEVSVYQHRHDIHNAIAYALKADSVRIIARDTIGLIFTRHNLAAFYRVIGLLVEEAVVLRRLMQLGFRPDQPKTVYARKRYCYVMREMGDYPSAIQHGLEAIRFAPLLKATDEKDEILGGAHLDLATAYDDDNQPDSAIHHFEIALEVLEETDDLVSLRALYNNLGNFYRGTGLPQKAADAYLTILSDPVRYDLYPEDIIDYTNNLALAYKDLGQFEQAYEAIDQARRLAWLQDPHTYRLERARVWDNIAAIQEAQGSYSQAVENYQRAISTLLNIPENRHISINPDKVALDTCDYKVDLLVFLTDKARGMVQLGDGGQNAEVHEYALATLEVAASLLDEMRAEQSNQATRLDWRSKARTVFEDAIKLALTLGRPDYALTFAEKGRAIIALDGLRHFAAQQVIKPEDLSRGDSLNQELEDVDLALIETTDPSQRAELNSKRNLILNAITDYRAEIETTYPEYHTLMYQAAPPSLSNIQENLLTPGQTMVIYTAIDTGMSALAISADTSQLIPLDLPQHWQDSVRNFVNMLASQEMSYAGFNRLAHDLYQWLIEPLNLSNDQLIIVPDGVLATLPFDVLLTDSWDEERFKGAPFLIRRHQVSYALSAQLLMQATSMQIPGSGLLAVAPSFAARPKLKELTNNEEEVGNILKLFKGSSIVGESATIDSFIHNKEKYSCYHFATHGVFDNAHADRTSLEFADAPFYMQRMYTTRLPADMVVLSACQTANGVYRNGEGVMSLAHAFTVAGAKSVVPTLWSINDRTAQEVMTAFYKHLATGLDKSEALHQAKVDYLNEKDRKNFQLAPYYWAAFVSYGDMSPVTLQRRSKSTLWIGLGVLALTGFVLYRRRRKHA